jgi:hypothetical protein
MHGHPSYMRDHHTPVPVPAHTTPLTTKAIKGLVHLAAAEDAAP